MPASKLKCPICGSDMVVRVVYGKQPHTDELERDLESGRVVLRPGQPTEHDPRFQCQECSIGWNSYPRRRID